MPDKILILGGTKEAAELAGKLVEEGHEVISSLAGRTREPKPVAGYVRSGGFGGATGLAQWITENAVTRIIDATHPFAVQISQNAVAAARLSKVPIERYERAPWVRKKDDMWMECASINEAVSLVPREATVLLALGSQHIAPFATRDDVHFVVRMIDEPKSPLPFRNCTLILARPSNDWSQEAKVLTENKITQIVCRNSGGPGAYAKIEAARRVKVPVIMIHRPKVTETSPV
ncbi:MAG: cobalt-precorrin-6A reductase [Pseudomonadota bacterium]